LAIKGRASQGNVLSKNPVKKIVQAEKGFSTLGARHIWYDDTVMRLNTDQRGVYLGAFKEADKILTLTRSGYYKLISFDLSNHFEEDMSLIEKFNPNKAITVLYYNEPKQIYFLKRFIPELSDKKISLIPEEEGNIFINAVTDKKPLIRVEYNNEGSKKELVPEEILPDEFVEIMGIKAKGKKISNHPILNITWLEPIPVEEEEEIALEEESEIQEDSERVENMFAEEESSEDSKPLIQDVVPPVLPPEFPDDDDSGTGIQMTLF